MAEAQAEQHQGAEVTGVYGKVGIQCIWFELTAGISINVGGVAAQLSN